MRPGNSGRALLLELLADGEIPEGELMALLGVHKQERGNGRKAEDRDFESQPDPTRPGSTPGSSTPPPAPRDIPFWTISHYHSQSAGSDHAGEATIIPLDRDFFSGGSPFTAPSERLWRVGELRPRLMKAARQTVSGRRIHTPRLVKELSRGRIPPRLPRYPIESSRPGLWVVLDHRPDSALFRQDINRVKRLLRKTLGLPGEGYQLISVTSATHWGYRLPLRQGSRIDLRQLPASGRLLLVAPGVGDEARDEWETLLKWARKEHTTVYWLDPANPSGPVQPALGVRFIERAPRRRVIPSALCRQSRFCCPASRRAGRYVPGCYVPCVICYPWTRRPSQPNRPSGVRVR